MKSFAIVISLALCQAISINGQGQDRSVIRSVTEEYLIAWYQGDEQLMASVVHPQMAKKIVFDTGSNQGALAFLSAEDLLKQTKKKRPQSFSNQDLKSNITILDVYNNSAMVKAETRNWIDYLPVSYTHLTLPTNREV